MNHPDIEPVGEKSYRLEHDYTVAALGAKYTIPKGYIYDGSSAPPFLWPIGYRPDGLWRAAACAHDWAYEHGGKLEEGDLTRKGADLIYKILALNAGKDELDGKDLVRWKRKCRIAYSMLRMWGWYYWGKPSRLKKLRNG